ncbi:hypothetical protein A7985_15150 [Pseudoalteromonas luteoviolacea]|uniref:Uncharacterized protein n=1 Tax=Pseudoalteromonas luteoviolacea TaxID=43657 RepID=A0A1C0TN89_9GAMM|nr:hypothetical protein [Pseudoalteromonas luteoviolacea]OCQ20401.1 hypothetical protein A7985_15150 [Pseudoalteromonas luteoviolacea]
MTKVKLIFCVLLIGCIATFVWWMAHATIINPFEHNPSLKTDPVKHQNTQKRIPTIASQSPRQLQRPPKLTTEPAIATLPPIPPPSKEKIYIPPIAQKAKTDSAPKYRGDLSDHESYNDFLLEQEQALKKDYIAAVDKKVERLSQLLQKGVNAGLPHSQLNEAREKISALKGMKAYLEKELKAQQ